MVPNRHKLSRKLLRVLLFALAVYIGILGTFLVLDSFVPREKPVGTWVYIAQFIAGVVFLVLSLWLASRNRLQWKSGQVDPGLARKGDPQSGE